MDAAGRTFLIARNPAAGSRLPVLLRVPLPGGPLLLATNDDWPATRDLYCHRLDAWPDGAEVIAEVPVGGCWRSGAAVHLVLTRRSRKRSLFVFTSKHGRPLIFWRSQRTVRNSRPALRTPLARGLERALRIAIDTRERYPWRFAAYPVTTERRRLSAGDYAVFEGGEEDDALIATVERKGAAELATGLSTGAFQMGLSELAALPRAAVVIEGRLSQIVKAGKDHEVRPGWLLNLLAALQASHPNVPLLFAETPSLAADLAYRWLAACRLQARGGSAVTGAMAEVAHDFGGTPVRGAAAAEMRAQGPNTSAPLFATLGGAPLPPAERRADAVVRAAAGTVWTPRAFAATYGVTAQTAGNDLRALRDTGALIARGRGRALRYRHPAADASAE